MKTRSAHQYISTACEHGQCGSCRATCKFCDAPCLCKKCHPQDTSRHTPPSWVDQARGGFLRILAHLPAAGVDLAAVDPHLARAIAEDPAWFWARGEIQPDGVWTPPAEGGPSSAGAVI